MDNRVTTYSQAFGMIGVKIDNSITKLLKRLESEGHTEKSISYAIWRTQDKLNKFIGDSRFMNILQNEICKHSWGKDDPRWAGYWKKKNKELEIENRIKKDNEEKERYLADHPYSKVKYGSPSHEIVQHYIYFVQGESGGSIKIGTTTNPADRIKALSTGFPEPLRVLALIPGDVERERKAHKYFNKHRIKGEWFRPDPELIGMIDKLKTKYSQTGY